MNKYSLEEIKIHIEAGIKNITSPEFVSCQALTALAMLEFNKAVDKKAYPLVAK